MLESPPEHVLVPPSFSKDGNTGIEQCYEYLGVYTACCYNEPVPLYDGSGAWKCDNCGDHLSAYAPREKTTIDLRSSSETLVQEWLAIWLGIPYHDISVQISLP